MKRLVRKIAGIMLCCLLVFACIPNMEVKAVTLEESAAITVAFGESDELSLVKDTPLVMKLVLTENGSFTLDFRPGSVKGLQAELYDANSNLLSRGGYWYSNVSSISPSSIGYNKKLEAGVYYLRLYADETGTFTYFARQTPSTDASIGICVNLKKGKTMQLGTIFTNSKDKKVKWSSSNQKVATVSSDGKVKAVKTGTVTIKAYNSAGLVAKISVKIIA